MFCFHVFGAKRAWRGSSFFSAFLDSLPPLFPTPALDMTPFLHLWPPLFLVCLGMGGTRSQNCQNSLTHPPPPDRSEPNLHLSPPIQPMCSAWALQQGASLCIWSTPSPPGLACTARGLYCPPSCACHKSPFPSQMLSLKVRLLLSALGVKWYGSTLHCDASLVSAPRARGDGVGDGVFGVHSLGVLCIFCRLLLAVAAASTHARLICRGVVPIERRWGRLIS
jgi:hypothetical protein